MNYTENANYLASYASDLGYVTDPDFAAQEPIFIRSGELRVLRDLDLLNTRVTVTGALTPFTRLFTLPGTEPWQVVETASIRMDYDQIIDGTLFTQPPLLWVSKEFLDAAYPDDNAVGAPSVPQYIAPYTDTVYAVGPAPGVAYPIVCYGVQWPETLSASNTETFISINLPDVFLAAQMCDVALWLKQFGQQADEPGMSVDWQGEYEKLKAQAKVMELRRAIQASGWGIRPPNPVNPAMAA